MNYRTFFILLDICSMNQLYPCSISLPFRGRDSNTVLPLLIQVSYAYKPGLSHPHKSQDHMPLHFSVFRMKMTWSLFSWGLVATSTLMSDSLNRTFRFAPSHSTNKSTNEAFPPPAGPTQKRWFDIIHGYAKCLQVTLPRLRKCLQVILTPLHIMIPPLGWSVLSKSISRALHSRPH